MAVMKVGLLFKMLKVTIGQEKVRSQQFSGEGVNFMPVEINVEEVIMACEGIINMVVPHLNAKTKASTAA